MKKQKSIKVTVPKPCTESWDNMQPDRNGRFCSSCDKAVIDFSKLSDSEIYKVLSENNSKICGRFSAFQLNRRIFPQVQNNKSILPKVLFSIAIAAFSINSGIAQEIFAEIHPSTVNLNNENSCFTGPEFGKDSTKFIRGKIIDIETSKPIQFADVNFIDLGTSVMTDKNGFFELEMIEDYPYPENLKIVVYYEGIVDYNFEIEFPFKKNGEVTEVKIFAEPELTIGDTTVEFELMPRKPEAKPLNIKK